DFLSGAQGIEHCTHLRHPLLEMSNSCAGGLADSRIVDSHARDPEPCKLLCQLLEHGRPGDELVAPMGTVALDEYYCGSGAALRERQGSRKKDVGSANLHFNIAGCREGGG